MSVASRASLSASVFYAIRIICAILIVTVVLMACLPLKRNYSPGDRGSNRFGGRLRNRLWGSLFGSGGWAWKGNVGHLNAEFREPVRVFGENILINDGAPEKETGFRLPRVH